MFYQLLRSSIILFLYFISNLLFIDKTVSDLEVPLTNNVEEHQSSISSTDKLAQENNHNSGNKKI